MTVTAVSKDKSGNEVTNVGVYEGVAGGELDYTSSK